jgi:FtsH-binding integral membrane protein
MSSSYEMPQAYTPIGQASVDARARFISRTYNHLMGSIVLFTLMEIWLFTTGMAEGIAAAMMGSSWLLILGGFMLVTWLATRSAHTSQSKPAQYAALFAVVAAYAVLFVPMLYIANSYADGTIESAALVTMLGFGGLTAVAFTTRKDFSFMGSALRWGGVVALLAIVGGVLFGFQLGTWFSVAMVGFAGAAILYDTSNVLLHCPEDRYVGAALQLFASVAMMFWYILRIFMGRD